MGGSGILAELLGLKQSYGIIRYRCRSQVVIHIKPQNDLLRARVQCVSAF